MIDATTDLKHSTYSQEDESARRLWLTQRTLVNPWEHRSRDTQGDAETDPEGLTAASETAALITLIPQTDNLQLEVHEAHGVDNPFAHLVMFRLGSD